MKPKASSVIIVNDKQQCLLQLRDSTRGILFPCHWSLIGGSAERAETPIETVRRECLEETGLQGMDFHYFMQFETPFHIETVFWCHYINSSQQIICGEGECNKFINIHQVDRLKMAFNHDLVCKMFARYLPEMLREE